LLPGALPGGRRLADDDERGEVEAVWGQVPAAAGRSLHGILEAAAEGEIDVLYLVGVDLLHDCDRPALARRALERATVIAHDLLATATAQTADVLLPAAAPHERGGAFTNWEGRSQPFLPAIPAPHLVQEDWDILVQLAGLLGRDLGFSELDGVRAEMRRLGRTRAAEEPGARTWPQDGAGVPDEQGDDDRLELVSYPLLVDRGAMLAGARHLLETAKQPFAAIGPADARRLGLRAGHRVALATDHGRVELPLRVEEDLAPGVIFMPSNSTDEPVGALAGDIARPVRVRVEAAGEEAPA
ncbi:MAG: molybdopterin-dependent oxidoreductase, partial [Actinomycetota bacterium]|nr:molybdopterin-dependent oxidoreductase [Actinomycetota bacterium]